MKPLLPLLFAAALLTGASLHAEEAAPGKTETAEGDAANDRLPAVALTPRLLYRFLLAEIAGQRGQLASAAELYYDLARETRDPRIARRATEMALHGRHMEIGLQAAQLWLDIEPTSTQAHHTLISLLAAQGRFDELKTLVADLLAAEPQSIGPSLMRLNRLFARSNDRPAVRTLIEQLTAPYLELPEAHYARALAAFDTRDAEAARGAIRRALDLRPNWEDAALFRIQLIENRAEALAALKDFLAAHPLAHNARLAYARALVGEKRYEEARREFGILLEQGANAPEKHGDVIFAVAVLSLQLNDTEQAERQLRRLIEIGHAEADKARYYLGQIAEDSKRWDEALQWFDQVGRGEHYLPARLHAANVLARQDKLDLARRHLAETEAANPRERVQLLIGEAQILREAGQLSAAHAVLVAGLTHQPDQPELLYETALLAEKMGRSDELETRLRRLIELRPEHAHALNALGFSLAERNTRLDEALELIERALQLAPNDPFILDSKGWVLFRRGDLPGALAALNTAYGIRADPEIAAHLGEVLWLLDRRDEARSTWETARREHPANEVLAETIKRFQP